MLPGAGLGDDPRLAHAAGKDDLPQHVVDLVCAGVRQVFALDVDARPAEVFRQPSRIGDRCGTPDKSAQQMVCLLYTSRCV